MTDPRTPADLQRFISESGIEAVIVPMPVETPTVLAAAEALRVERAQIIKTLIFLVKETAVVVIASGDTLVDKRPIADRFGIGKKQVRLADRETALAVTGYEVGGVPPFGHATQAAVLLDKRVAAWDVVYGGGGDDRTLLRITPSELVRVTRAEWLALT